jgi:hypothetical protein
MKVHRFAPSQASEDRGTETKQTPMAEVLMAFLKNR